MKLEIKLNQEQFDLLITSLVQIAQGCVRMADSWESPKADNCDIVDAVIKHADGKKKQHWGGSKPKYDGYISSQAIYNDLGGGISQKMLFSACRQLGVEPRKFSDSNKFFIPAESRSALVDLLKKVKERINSNVEG